MNIVDMRTVDCRIQTGVNQNGKPVYSENEVTSTLSTLYNYFDSDKTIRKNAADKNNRDWYELIELLTKYKKGLYFYLDNQVYDCNNEFVMGIMMQIHAQFSRNLSTKIREAHQIRQRNKTGLNITSKRGMIYGF